MSGEPLDTDEEILGLEGVFGEKGALSREIADFKPRPQQIAMAKSVWRALSRQRHLVVEAGTGVGKSFGYLVPLLLGPIADGKRVIVSTQTLSLQDQLIEKDLPLLRRALGMEFRAEVAKGRGNYLAPRRLERALSEAAEQSGREEMLSELRRLSLEIGRTKQGTRQEILPLPWGEAWAEARSERHDCLGQNCPHFADDCWFHRARRRVFAADLIVVNHSLFFADLALREEGQSKGVLPDYDVVVFDEAHGLEATALAHFGASVSRAEVLGTLSKIHRPSRRRGPLHGVAQADLARAMVAEAARTSDRFFEAAWLVCERGESKEMDDDFALANEIGPPLAKLGVELERLAERQSQVGKRSELNYHAARVTELAEAAGQCLELNPDVQVNWIERGATKEKVSLEMRPLDVGGQLRDLLFSRVGTAILASATLAVGRNEGLSWIAHRLGLPEADKTQLGSPFDFQSKVRLRVPTWLNAPSDRPEWLDRAAQAVLDYVERSQGGAFLLFTSYAAMRAVRDRIAPRLEQLGLPLLVQGDGLPRSVMLDHFRDDDHSVLMGADSFWQGVDIKGVGLRLVVIAKLPFPVPSLPVNRARARLIEARGGNSFRELHLPEAIVRFKQGFGRLIRSEEDEGTVVVLDTRILTKSYGRSFLDAIPRVPLIED
jgi:ATP-dependent DNA helicase DinG